MPKRICITTLGCDKNRCDSEQIAADLASAGFELVPSDDNAQIILVNTCAFLVAARREAINVILSKTKYKENGTCEKIIVTGCLPAYCKNIYNANSANSFEELEKSLPEVDLFVPPSDYHKLTSIIMNEVKSDTSNCSMFNTKTSLKLLSTPKSYAFIKIAEGCSNSCAYCTIPMIRGRYTSRSQSEILCEVKHFSELGVGEFLLVAQDTARYGTDNSAGSLASLIRKITAFPGVKRLRLHYIYPNGITDELINEIASNEKVCKYLDMPLQHVHTRILEKMNRCGSSQEYLALIKKLRAHIPNITLRSTFMTGFPTETDAEFQELLDFLTAAKLDYVGFFAFSRELGTRAYLMPQVPSKIKKARMKAASKLQSVIMTEKHEKMIGKTFKVVCDSVNEVLNSSVTRSQHQSPEVDPHIAVKGILEIGKDYNVRITGKKGSNLKGEIV